MALQTLFLSLEGLPPRTGEFSPACAFSKPEGYRLLPVSSDLYPVPHYKVLSSKSQETASMHSLAL